MIGLVALLAITLLLGCGVAVGVLGLVAWAERRGYLSVRSR